MVENKTVKQILELKKYPLERIQVSDLQHDKTNPNVMTDELFASLCYSLEKFGELEPIKVAPALDGKFLIIDGHHRVKAYEKEGVKDIPAYIIHDLSDTEIKLARQAFNKIHGEHVPERDIIELELILNHNAVDLEMLTGVNSDSIIKMKELMASPNQEQWAQNLEATANMDALNKSHQVTLIFSPKQFAFFNKTVNSVKLEKKEKDKGTTTLRLMTILTEYNKHRKGGVKISSKII